VQHNAAKVIGKVHRHASHCIIQQTALLLLPESLRLPQAPREGFDHWD
jgi:hypothetical protein